MNHNHHWKRMLATISAALLLVACGGAPDDTAAQQPAQVSPATGTVSAANIPQYDPEHHCIVSSSYVPCNNGFYMYAYWCSDVGYYIERNVCDRFGGPTICPFY